MKTGRRITIPGPQFEALAGAAHFQSRELARLCELSLRQLQRDFRRYLGCSPQAWLNDRKMQAARERLLAGDPVKRVALDLNFKHVSHFCMWFKAVNGMTSTEFVSSQVRVEGDVAEV